MGVVLSLIPKGSGEVIYYDNKSINDIGLKVGSLIEAPGLYKNASAYENMKRFSILYGVDKSKINEVLNMVGLGNTGKRRAKDFSLGIAIALLGDPELLILDEPINGLDPGGIKEITLLNLIKKKILHFNIITFIR